MSPEIRTRSLAEVLDASFQLVRDHVGLLVGLGLLVSAPNALFSAISRQWLEDLQLEGQEAILANWTGFAGMLAVVAAVSLLLPLTIAATTSSLGELYLGRSVDLKQALRAGLRRYFPLLFTFVVLMIVAAVAMGLLVVSISLGTGALALVLGEAGGVAGIGMTIALVVGLGASQLLALLVFFLIPPVVMLEGSSLFVAVARAWDLLSGMWLRALGVLLSAYGIILLPSLGFYLLTVPFPFAGGVLSALVQSVAWAFLLATAVVFYFDILCRKESFDLEHLARLVQDRATRHGGAPARPPAIG